MGAVPAAFAEETARQAFIRRTYTHLAGAILAFVAIEAIIFQVFEPLVVAQWAMQPGVWISMCLGFFAVSWIADSMARKPAAVGTQYLGLGLYVVAESLLFAPLLSLASLVGPEIIPTAGLMTGIIFGGLTMMVLVSKADFSWLRGVLAACMMGAFGLIICSWIFGFSLGVLFAVAMVVLASGLILYQTSAIMREYHTDMHVAAALGLFAFRDDAALAHHHHSDSDGRR